MHVVNLQCVFRIVARVCWMYVWERRSVLDRQVLLRSDHSNKRQDDIRRSRNNNNMMTKEALKLSRISG